MRTSPSRARSGRRGAALVAVAVVVMTLLALGFSFLAASLGASRAVEGSVDDRRAFYLAEAALAESVVALRGGASGAIGTADAPARLGSGIVWCRATDLGDGRHSIVATGMCRSGRAALEAVVSVGEDTEQIFPAMFLADEKLSIDSNQTIDSYDSSLGTYASQAVNTLGGKTYANAGGNVFSNGSIVVSTNTAIFGDATPGVGGGVSLDTGAVVTGSTAAAKTPFTMPVLETPTLPSTGTLNVAGTKTLAAGNYNYGSLKLKASSKLIVKGPAVIVTADFVTAENSTIEIDASGGPVTFYNIGTFSYDQKTTMTTSSGSPADVVFAFDSANPIVFPSGITFRGGIYAPMAPISIGASSTFFGAIVADNITMGTGTQFHYDEYLGKRTRKRENGPEVELLSWRPVALSDTSLAADRRDPMVLLDLDPNELPSPADAWGAEEK